MSETTPGETPVERRLREMAEQFEALAQDDECRAAEDDIEDAWRRSRLNSAHDLHGRKAACRTGADAIALLGRVVSGDIDESRIVKTAAALLARCEDAR